MKKAVKKNERAKKATKGDTFINVFAIIIFGGAFIWMGQSFYVESTNDTKLESAYLLSLPNPGDTISHNKVCMVDDIYIGNDLTVYPILIAGHNYYGCNLKSTQQLISDINVRLAEDPISKKRINKATAIITLHPDRDGKIIYFQSLETYGKYRKALAVGDNGRSN